MCFKKLQHILLTLFFSICGVAVPLVFFLIFYSCKVESLLQKIPNLKVMSKKVQIYVRALHFLHQSLKLSYSSCFLAYLLENSKMRRLMAHNSDEHNSFEHGTGSGDYVFWFCDGAQTERYYKLVAILMISAHYMDKDTFEILEIFGEVYDILEECEWFRLVGRDWPTYKMLNLDFYVLWSSWGAWINGDPNFELKFWLFNKERTWSL